MTVPLQMNQVAYSYGWRRGQVPVLEQFDLSVATGEWVALLGQSGSGKSTVLDLASGVRVPKSGTVRLMDHDVGTLSTGARADLRLQWVAHIFQNFRLFPNLDTLANVAVVLRMRGEPRDVAEERAEAALGRVGLRHRMQHRPDELSGGEQQRVAIARAVVSEPAVLLADEPTGSLDAHLRDDVLELVAEVLPRAATVLVTHDAEVAARAHRVVRMDPVAA